MHKAMRSQGVGKNLHFSASACAAFGEAAQRIDVPEGVQPDSLVSCMPQRVFAPDELKIGSIVFGRLKPLFGADYTKNDDFRPLLVTGLWRRGNDVEKIETMSFSSVAPKKMYPCIFPFTLPHLKGASRKSFLNTSSLYLLENKASLFSKGVDRAIARVDDEIWSEILVRRADAVVYNPSCRFIGQCDFSLEREGFIFDSIPFNAVRSRAFVPEVQTQARLSRPVNILSQERVNDIVSFAISYTEHMKQKNRHAYFLFPDIADWPRDLPETGFPRWDSLAPKAGGLRPHLP
ncbi:MAG TPA: hypothetical protein VFS88_02095 [Micavibrio sp.]|nr:hypothetical protein [Micavibrio sp.]